MDATAKKTVYMGQSYVRVRSRDGGFVCNKLLQTEGLFVYIARGFNGGRPLRTTPKDSGHSRKRMSFRRVSSARERFPECRRGQLGLAV